MTFVPSAASMTRHDATGGAAWVGGPEILDGFSPALQGGTLLNGIFVEANEGDLEARAAALGGELRRIEIPAEPTARRDFFAQWSAGNALWRRGVPMSLLLLPLAACGGGGGGSTPVPGAAGAVVNGYISGATVFRDVNGNGVRDNNEPMTTTNAGGGFAGLLGSTADTIIASGGTNLTTNAPYFGILKAPGTATIISPLTTLVSEVLAATPNLTTAQAVAQVRTSLGLGAIDILSTDPIGSGNTTLLKANLQVANLINAVGGGANGQAVAARLAALTTQARDLTDLAFLTQVITGASIPVNAAAVAALVDQQNDAIAAAANTTNAILAVQAAQPDNLTVAQFKALANAPAAGTYSIADTPENIQAAANSNTDRTILTNASNVIASTNTFMTLPVAVAVKLLSSNYDISDTGAAITAASDSILAGARAISVTQGSADVTVVEARKVTLGNGASYRVVDTVAAIEAQIGTSDQGNVLATASQIAVTGAGTLSVPLALALKLAANTTYNVIDTTAIIQARITASLTDPALDDVLLAAQSVDTSDGGTLNVPVALASKIANAYNVSDSSANIQAQINGSDAGGLLAGSEEIRVVGDQQPALVVTAALAEKVAVGTFNILDTAAAINNAPPNTLAAAGTVTVQGTEGNDGLSLLQVSRGLIINGLGGNDTLVGGDGIDSIAGGTGADRIDGALGDDALTGDAGNDVLLGNDGNDTLSGGADADTLTGGSGDDQLSGGAGSDVFVFSTSLANNGVDTVAGFEVGAAGDDIDFAFNGAGEDFQDVLHGTGTLVQQLADGGILDDNAGLALITTSQGALDAALAQTLANGLQAVFADGDVLFMAFDNGTNTGIFRLSDSVEDEDTAFDQAELLVTLQGVTVGTLAPENFVDFAPVQPPV